MEKIIKQKLSEYLEFDIDILFTDNNIVYIFGGAIRDIIADQKINDVDILCGSKSIDFLENILEKNGYTYMESLLPKGLGSIYSNIHIICEPHTWIKNTKIVQLIRPSGTIEMSNKHPIEKEKLYKEIFNDLISNVDLSCCGISYNLKINEHFPNAILHAKHKVFFVNTNAKMFSEKRIFDRICKMKSRGWSEIDEKLDIFNRHLKIKEVIG